MKYLIILLTVLALGSILCGFVLSVPFAEKLIGFGVVGLFLVVFPLFSWYRWKHKKVEDYMLTKENLKKMRERESDKRR
ncbi:MAG TPA: hypothetical protein VKZ98_08670 [Aquaticitalea sp.]|nr:hypothetical protein [Aquaticitalea sp.]